VAAETDHAGGRRRFGGRGPNAPSIGRRVTAGFFFSKLGPPLEAAAAEGVGVGFAQLVFAAEPVHPMFSVAQ